MRSFSRRTACSAAGALLLTLATVYPAGAEDIDLYSVAPATGNKPNILIVIDNGANFDAAAPNFTGCTAYPSLTGSGNSLKSADAEKCALYGAMDQVLNGPYKSVLLGAFNLGIMLMDSSSPGGVLVFPSTSPATTQQLALMDGSATGVPAALTYIQNNFSVNAKTSVTRTGGTMQEAWAFYARRMGLSGTPYDPNHSSVLNLCQHNYVIYIGNATKSGGPGDNGPSAQNALSNPVNNPSATSPPQATWATPVQQGQASEITPVTNVSQSDILNWGDEWARYMFRFDLSGNVKAGQNITTYTIAVAEADKGSTPPTYTNNSVQSAIADYGSMADRGGGTGYKVQLGDAQGLQGVLLKIFNEVNATNSAFASVSLPAAVNTQGQFLNQVYVGMFRPDGSDGPRWMGNLKQYQIGTNATTGKVELQDSLLQSAISSAGTGFISANAVSFWTSNPTGTTSWPWPANGFWWNFPQSAGGYLDSPDGELVEKGAVSELLRETFLTSQDSRVVYTCDGVLTGSSSKSVTGNNCSKGLTTFDQNNTGLVNTLTSISTSNGAPTIPNSTEAKYLINWVRGRDVYVADASANPAPTLVGKEAEQGPGTTGVTVRPSIHGDVLHSRPVVVNYGTAKTPNIVVYYGANDGVFHAINGNKPGYAGNPSGNMATAAGVTVPPGGELWGFVAPEFLGKLSRLYADTPVVKLSTTVDPTATPRDYFFDGSTTVMQDQRTGHNTTMIYLTARRGGNLMYALDVSDPTMPPKYVWSLSNANIPELGQTWSKPRLMMVQGYANPVLIMGGGYDTAEDKDSDSNGNSIAPSSDSVGRDIIVVDAYTGAVVWDARSYCGQANAPSDCQALTHSIPSDVAAVDPDGDGYADRAYVGDVGGNVWRVDFVPPPANSTNATVSWTLTRLAQLGGAAGSNSYRKFFYPPDVVPTKNFDAVLIGSGDREHPLYTSYSTSGLAYNVNNQFYMLQAPSTTGMPAGWKPLTVNDLANVSATTSTYTVNATLSPSNISGSCSTTSPINCFGFYIQLPNPGEKVVNAPLTVAGYTTFGTNAPTQPNSGKCSALGTALSYSVNFLTAAGQNTNRSITLQGGGFPPSAVFGLVQISTGGTTTTVPILIGSGDQTNAQAGGNGASALGVQKVNIPATGHRKRTYWYSETDKKP